MDIFADIDEGLQAIKDSAPTLMADVPALKALAPWLPLLGITMQAVDTVQTAQGGTLAQAVQTVAQHLTPGQPDTSVLTQAAPASAPATDTASQIAAAAAAVAAPTPDAAQDAVTQAVAALPGGT